MAKLNNIEIKMSPFITNTRVNVCWASGCSMNKNGECMLKEAILDECGYCIYYKENIGLGEEQ